MLVVKESNILDSYKLRGENLLCYFSDVQDYEDVC